MRAHEIVESALAARTVDAMTVICQEHSQTNLRWAANTLTTNGVMHSRRPHRDRRRLTHRRPGRWGGQCQRRGRVRRTGARRSGPRRQPARAPLHRTRTIS